MAALIAWLSLHWAVIASVLLGVSEALAVVFPSSTGFGGMIAGLIKILKSFGAQAPPAA